MPVLARGTVHTDTLESIAWGLQWQFGYDKHPQLAAWISAAATLLGGRVGWPVYLVGSLNILACFWAVWQLAQRLLTPAQALLSVCLLETIWYYSLLGPKFDPNTLMISLWAITTLATYLALERGESRWWLAAGLGAGCAFIAKYQSAVFLVSLLGAILSSERGRQAWKGRGPYLALLVFALVISPNFYWLSQHDFISWRYAAGRVDSGHSWLQPWVFLFQQAGTLAIFLFAVILLARYRKIPLSLSTWQRRFCWWVGLGPLLVSLALSLSMGLYLYAKWAAPYFSLFGLLAVMALRPDVTAKQAKAWVGVAMALTLSVALARGLYLTYFPSFARDHYIDAFYPYPAIAQEAERLWQAEGSTPLHFVAGNHYLAAGLTAYLSTHPAPYFDWDPKQSAWMNETDLQRDGGVFAWDVSQTSFDLAARYPTAKFLGVKTFASTNPRQKLTFSIAFAVLPPYNMATTAK